MRRTSPLDCLAGLPQPEDLSQFRKDIDPEWVEAALQATGTATIRTRRLPAVQVIWLVIGMALFRNRGIAAVANSLDLALPSGNGGATAAPSSVSQARDRLGEEPVAWLFVRSADEWAHGSAGGDRWRGLSLYGVDGTTLRVPDSDENREHFGLASGGKRGNSGYPLVRLVAVMALRSHLIANVAFGPYKDGEYTYAAELWDTMPDDSLTLIDKNFLSAALLLSLQQAGKNRHWLLPAKSTTKWRRLKRLGKGDELVEMNASSTARRKHPWLPRIWTARAIRYQRKGFKPRTLLTSLVDPELYPANEIVELYHERWEIGVSREGRINQSVKVRPRQEGSKPRSLGGAAERERNGEALRQTTSEGGVQIPRLQRAVNVDVASLHANSVAETVDNVRRQQGTVERSPKRPPLIGGVSAVTWGDGLCGNWRSSRCSAKKSRRRGPTYNREWEMEGKAPGWRIGA